MPEKILINSKDIGRSGEQIAARFLISKGSKLLEKNWRFGRLEVDLIVMDGEELVFVEVKTTAGKKFEAADYLNRSQIMRIKKAALAYAGRLEFNPEFCRLDLIAVKIDCRFASAKICHLKNIF